MPAEMLNVGPENRLKSLARRIVAIAARAAWPLIPKSWRLGDGPRSLHLALTRKCNANCVFCAYQYAPRSARIHMPDDIFASVIEQIARNRIDYVMLSPNIGEPTIAPHFLEKVRRLRDAGARTIEMTSNALYWHKIGIDDLIRSGPDRVNISFAGFDKDMYERDFRVHHYEQTKDNILTFIRRNAELGSPVAVQFWLRGDRAPATLDESPELRSIADAGVPIQIMTEVDSWLELIKPEDLPEGYVLQDDRPKLTSRPCNLLNYLTLLPDGDIQLCACRNVFGDPDMHVGHLSGMTLQEAHARIPAVLNNWEQGKVPASCRTCSMYSDPAQGAAAMALRRMREAWPRLSADGKKTTPERESRGAPAL